MDDTTKPPPVVLKMHVADASLLLAQLLDLNAQVRLTAAPGSTESRIRRVTDDLRRAMLNWPEQREAPHAE